MSVPKLRFKEFDGDWSESKLKDCIDSIDSGWSPQCESYPADENEWAVLKTTSVDWDGFKANFNKKLPSSLEARFEIEVKPSDILVTRAGPTERVGVVAVVPQNVRSKLMISDKLIRLKANSDNSPEFLGISLSSVKCQNQLQSKTSGLAKSQTNISQKILSDVSLMTPAKEEQTKIASFLSAVDEKISQLTQKHALLSQYKQGMMQKLFSQQIRFKADDGSEFGEWEEKTLIDSVDTNIKWSFTGGPFGSNLKSEDYTELGIRIIQLQNIGDGAFLNDYKIYTSPEKANELLSCNIYPDEILISKMGDPVARCCIVPKHHDRYVMCSDGIRLVVDKKNYSSIFMFYQINYQDFRQSASDVSTGSTRKRIGLSDLKQLPIKAPCLEEQTKIANFLSAIDKKIEVVAQQIEQAKHWKKGLLQQMFV
ncbi:restriction endonuclease subunit S [Acinetobacter junii]|uniref:restriction endonuclease subunit S n=1 Tax=Acinetobacter junii TaxID=40215 RepID=UPI0035F8C475